MIISLPTQAGEDNTYSAPVITTGLRNVSILMKRTAPRALSERRNAAFLEVVPELASVAVSLSFALKDKV